MMEAKDASVLCLRESSCTNQHFQDTFLTVNSETQGNSLH
jgi:hypothetical protein